MGSTGAHAHVLGNSWVLDDAHGHVDESRVVRLTCAWQCLTLVVRSKKPPHLIHLALPANGSFGINSDTFVHAGSWDLSEWLRIWETRSLPHETLNVPPPTYPQLHVRMRVVRKL
jgi:hypothetical protein